MPYMQLQSGPQVGRRVAGANPRMVWLTITLQFVAQFRLQNVPQPELFFLKKPWSCGIVHLVEDLRAYYRGLNDYNRVLGPVILYS